jgi:hypothetical protein
MSALLSALIQSRKNAAPLFTLRFPWVVFCSRFTVQLGSPAFRVSTPHVPEGPVSPVIPHLFLGLFPRVTHSWIRVG